MTLMIRHPNHSFRIIYGTSAKKDAFHSLSNIIQYADKIHLIQAKNARSMDIEELKEAADTVSNEIRDNGKGLFEEIIEKGSIASTIEFAFNQCNERKKNEIIVITGSFYVMQEVRTLLGFQDEFDPFELNEIIAPEDRKKST